MTSIADGLAEGDVVNGGEVVRVCTGGPVLVRGADSFRDESGEEHAVTRPLVALCACGKSSRKPWCDSTHKSIPRP